MLQNAEKIMHSFIPTEPRSRHGISVPAVCHREKRVVVGGKLYIDVLTRHCVLIKIMIAFFFIYSLLQGKKYDKLSVRGYWLQFVRVYK